MNIRKLIYEITFLTKEQLQVAYQNTLIKLKLLSNELKDKDKYILYLEDKVRNNG